MYRCIYMVFPTGGKRGRVPSPPPPTNLNFVYPLKLEKIPPNRLLPLPPK